MTAETLSPTFSFISSALRLVITLSITFFPARTTTWAMTPPNWISTTLPSMRFLADRVMPQSIRRERLVSLRPIEGAVKLLSLSRRAFLRDGDRGGRENVELSGIVALVYGDCH